jgi:hypothetical protein
MIALHDHFRREPYLSLEKPRADVDLWPRRIPARSRTPAKAKMVRTAARWRTRLATRR